MNLFWQHNMQKKQKKQHVEYLCTALLDQWVLLKNCQ